MWWLSGGQLEHYLRLAEANVFTHKKKPFQIIKTFLLCVCPAFLYETRPNDQPVSLALLSSATREKRN